MLLLNWSCRHSREDGSEPIHAWGIEQRIQQVSTEALQIGQGLIPVEEGEG